MTPRRLVLCLDGTWNNTYSLKKRDDGHDVLKPSNVLKLARAVLPRDATHDREQLTYYDVGVGSLTRYAGTSNRMLSRTDRFLGGAWGAGFEDNIERALTFVVLNHQQGDEVFIFGFSRGAAAAQGVTRFLDWAGGLPVKRDAYYLPRLFRKYLESRGKTSGEEAVAAINADRAKEKQPLPPLEPFQAIAVELLGVWDAVLALGSRLRGGGAHTSMASRRFHVGERPADCVRNARQALAIDEARYDLRPEIWKETHNPGQSLEQRWFAGVHSNVGGGYVEDGLANVAFWWILREAANLGLAYDDKFARKYPAFPQARLYHSESILYRVADVLPARAHKGRRSLVGRPPSAHLHLDVSVLHRINADPSARDPRHPDQREFPQLRLYRPENVLEFLARQHDLDAYLTTTGIPGLPSDVVGRLKKGRSRNPLRRAWRWLLRR